MSVAWRCILFCLGTLTAMGARGDGFVKNAGQINDGKGGARADVQFMHQGRDRSVILRDRGFSYQFSSVIPDGGQGHMGGHRVEVHRIDIDFPGSAGKVSIQADPGTFREVHYASAERMVIAETAEEVLYRNVYEGVDIHFRSVNGEFKYDILCRDQAALERVRFRYSGSKGPLELDQAGSIVLQTRFGAVEERIPESYFHLAGSRVPVQVMPTLLHSTGEVGFTLKGSWPAGHSLVIDPLPYRLWSTYLGGSGYDDIAEVEVGADGGALVAGHTDSDANIATVGAFQQDLAGIQNLFLVAYDGAGQKLFGTYFGGTVADRCYALLRDPQSGSIYMAGGSFSSGMATPGAHQTELASVDDALLLKFNAAGILEWSTYYGGDDHDLFTAMEMDGQGDLVLTGHTKSSFGISTDMSVLPGTENIFVAKFTPDGALVWGTYLGGTFDSGWAIGVDANDNVLVAGGTASVFGIATPGAHQEVQGGGSDAFLAKYDSNGTLDWSTYFGGGGSDIAFGLVVSADGSVVIAGTTESPNGMATPGAGQAAPGSIDDGFLTRFSAEGVQLWGTYIGGEQLEHLTSLEQRADGGLVAAGWGQSTTAVTLPNAFQPVPAGEFDALVMSFSASGQFEWGTYYGGPLSEYLNDIVIDPGTGHILAVGNTRSASGIAVPDAQDPQPLGGLYDGFLARFCVPPSPSVVAPDGLLLCGPGTLSFELEAEFPQMQWNVGGTGQSVDLTPSGPGMFDIYCTVVDETGCPGSSDTLTVRRVEPFEPEIDITADPAPVVCLGEEQQVSVDPVFAAYRWWNGEEGNGTTVLLTDTMASWLQLTVFNADGCSATDSVLVQALDCTAIATPGAPSALKVIPNPSSGSFHVEYSGHTGEVMNAALFAADGRPVQRFRLVLGRPVHVDLAPGLYVLVLEAQRGGIPLRTVLQLVGP